MQAMSERARQPCDEPEELYHVLVNAAITHVQYILLSGDLSFIVQIAASTANQQSVTTELRWTEFQRCT